MYLIPKLLRRFSASLAFVWHLLAISLTESSHPVSPCDLTEEGWTGFVLHNTLRLLACFLICQIMSSLWCIYVGIRCLVEDHGQLKFPQKSRDHRVCGYLQIYPTLLFYLLMRTWSVILSFFVHKINIFIWSCDTPNTDIYYTCKYKKNQIYLFVLFLLLKFSLLKFCNWILYFKYMYLVNFKNTKLNIIKNFYVMVKILISELFIFVSWKLKKSTF